MSDSSNRVGGSGVLLVALGISAVIACGVVGFVIGSAQAPDQDDAATERAGSFRSSYSLAFKNASTDASVDGVRDGVALGVAQGKKSGGAAGANAGQRASDAEVERIEEERIAAEAAAAEAAELAIPEPCRGMPDSTARRMCIAAVEAGTYP